MKGSNLDTTDWIFGEDDWIINTSGVSVYLKAVSAMNFSSLWIYTLSSELWRFSVGRSLRRQGRGQSAVYRGDWYMHEWDVLHWRIVSNEKRKSNKDLLLHMSANAVGTSIVCAYFVACSSVWSTAADFPYGRTQTVKQCRLLWSFCTTDPEAPLTQTRCLLEQCRRWKVILFIFISKYFSLFER